MNRIEIEDLVIEVVSDTLNVPRSQVSPTTRIREELKADSMDIVTLTIALDSQFGIEFNMDEIPESDVSVQWITEFLEKKLICK
ncbi:MAG: acyl carrier protein [Gammaproteobacteria bacterium]|nr:acyl carrier protein [Gammaproteobacteria bacterium]